MTTTDAGGPGGEPAGGGFGAADPAAPGWGTAFGSGYLLQRQIGVGGMGTVWRGWSTTGQHAVAVKVLHPHLAADAGIVARFLREGDVLKRLEHPNLVKVHDLVVEGGRLGLVMDLVEGGDLHRRRKRCGTLAPAEAARIGAQAAAALAAAHALSIAHLDLKPANILISGPAEPDSPADAREPGEPIDVRLTDFGISRIMDAPDQATTTTAYGTPDYIAPETGLTGSTGPACDLYALGITLYEVLTGRTPYGGGNALTVLARHIERMPKRLRTIPDPLWEVIAACTASEPADRPDAAGIAAYLAAAEPGLAGVPAAQPLPAGTGFEATSEPRAGLPNAVTVAVPWLAAVAAANRPPARPATEEPDAADGAAAGPAAAAREQEPSAGDEAFAAAMRKPPPQGPFSTVPTRPDGDEFPAGPAVVFSHAARRRTALIGAPLLVLAVVGALFAAGTFDGAPTQNGADLRAPAAQGPPGEPGSGPGAAGNATTGTGTGPGSASGSARAGAPKPPAGTASGATAAPGGVPVGGSSTVVIETTTDEAGGGTTTVPTTAVPAQGAPTTAHPSASASPSPTDTGWVCRSGGFKVDGALSEDPCVRDDDGTLMLEGELKGTYDSSVVVVVRVDYGGSLSSAHISEAVTPAELDGKTFVYQVAVGAWAANEVITCQENVDPASDKTDYAYTSNSADLRT